MILKRTTRRLLLDRLAASAAVGLSLFFATCGGGGGGGGGGTPTPQNPQPNLTSISPTGAATGGGAFTLTVNGSSFISNSLVRWNGADRPTTFTGSTRLTAAIPASDIAADGAAQVTVFNPTPGGGTSGSAAFTIAAPSPIAIGTSQLPATAGGKSYDFTLEITGGISPYVSSISAGALPAGLTIVPATGRIVGVPGAVGVDTPFDFTVQVADSAATPVTGTRALTIMVRAAENLGGNDSCAGGVGGTAISNGRIRASISPYGDVDVYSFHGTVGKQITIEIFAQRLNLDGVFGTRDSQMDSMLELLGSTCPDSQPNGTNALAFNDDLSDPPNHVQDSRIPLPGSPGYILPTTGTYFIRVRDFRGDGRPDLIYELALSGAD